MEDYGKRPAGAERFRVSRQRNGERGPEGGGSSERSDAPGLEDFFCLFGPFFGIFSCPFPDGFLRSLSECFMSILGAFFDVFFMKKPHKTYTGARSTKITTLLFFVIALYSCDFASCFSMF